MYLDSVSERMLAIRRVGESSDAMASLEQPLGDVAARVAEGARYYVQFAIISHCGPVLLPNARVDRPRRANPSQLPGRTCLSAQSRPSAKLRIRRYPASRARPTIWAVFAVFALDGRRSGGTPRVPKPSCGIVVPLLSVMSGLLLMILLSLLALSITSRTGGANIPSVQK